MSRCLSSTPSNFCTTIHTMFSDFLQQSWNSHEIFFLNFFLFGCWTVTWLKLSINCSFCAKIFSNLSFQFLFYYCYNIKWLILAISILQFLQFDYKRINRADWLMELKKLAPVIKIIGSWFRCFVDIQRMRAWRIYCQSTSEMKKLLLKINWSKF